MHEGHPHGPKSPHWNRLALSSPYLGLEQLDEAVNSWSEAFFLCLLGDDGQEGHEKLLVACFKKTLPQLPVWFGNRTVREMAVSTCHPSWAHMALGDVHARPVAKMRMSETAGAES